MLSGRFLDDLDLLVRQVVQFVDQVVDLPVGGRDLTLDEGFFVSRPRHRQLFVQTQHRLHQSHDAIVACLVPAVGKVERVNWEFTDVLLCAGYPPATKYVALLPKNPKQKS